MRQTTTEQKARYKENLGWTKHKNQETLLPHGGKQLFLHYTHTCGCNTDISRPSPSIWNRDYI
jgi:hypothetical protein